jgi:hypothetical protein
MHRPEGIGVNRRPIRERSSRLNVINNAICIAYVLIYAIIDVKFSLFFEFLVIGSTILRITLSKRVGSLSFIFYIAILYLYIPVSVNMIVDSRIDPLLMFALAVIGFDFVVYFSRANISILHRSTSDLPRDFVIWACLLAMALIGNLIFSKGGGSFLGLFAFTVPFAISLLLFERLVASCGRTKLCLMLFAYLITIGIYIVYFWGGFGRLVIGAYVLMPVLIADRYRDFGLRTWQAAGLAPLLLAVAYYSRNKTWIETNELGAGGAGHHLRLTMDLFYNPVYEYFGSFYKFADQYILLFLNWFPREYWENKPVGIGSYAVDEWIGRQGFGRVYNVSLGMFGEQLYTVGPYFLVAWIFLLITIIMLRRFIETLAAGYATPVVVFDVNMINYVWGGAASFGSRAWFFIVPLLMVTSVWRLTERKVLIGVFPQRKNI